MGLKLRNPKFNILCKITLFFFYKMPTLWSLKVNKAILERVKLANNMTECFNYSRNKYHVHKISFRNRVRYISFTSHQHLFIIICINIICIIYLESSTMNSFESFLYTNITLNCWVISKTINTMENASWITSCS